MKKVGGRLMIYKKRVNSLFFYAHTHYFKIAISTILLVFILGSLSSYHADDSSSWHYSTSSAPMHNLFGRFGAQCAALIWYLFGGAGSLLIGMLVFYLWLATRGKSIRAEFDRWISWFLLLVSLSSLAAFYQYDLLSHIAPGGLLGRRVASFLIARFEISGALLFIYSLLAISLVVLFQFTLSSLLYAAEKVIAFVSSKEHFWKPLYHGVFTVVGMIFWYSKRVIIYFYTMLSGSIIKDNYNHFDTIDFDEFFMAEQQENSLFWQKYCGKSLEDFDINENKETVEQDVDEQGFLTQSENEQSYKYAQTTHMHHPEQKNEQSLFTTATQSYSQPIAYQLPKIDIFIGRKEEHDDPALMRELENRAVILKEKLERFGVYGSVTAIKRGPVVTVFEYQPDIDSKISKIISLEDDLALALQALSIRIIAPIPGRSVVGFEVANSICKKVSFAKIISSASYQKFSGALPLLLGEDTSGSDVVVDLARMPHLLIAGSTGSGKSVALNSMLISLLCHLAPNELRLILIDPKRLEFASYADIAHLVFPIITEPKKVAPVLRYVIHEMEERYERMAKVNARNIFDYHSMMGSRESMPFMVIVIDELADLMMTAGREIEGLITRITQMARAAGIHMMVATQRPSVDVITGLIKVNFPSRISFRVTSKIDSRTILDSGGADKLLGRGDMLFLDSTTATIKRVHGAFVSDQEIMNVVSHIRLQQPACYLDLPAESTADSFSMDEADDQLYQEVLDFLQTIDEISISLLQRKFRIGFNRSARIIDMLEARGLILPGHGGKTRKVIR